MSEKQQITYMQTRLVRLATKEWSQPLGKVVQLFARWGVFPYIRECFDTFHVEGDQAVLEEIEQFLIGKGVQLCKN